MPRIITARKAEAERGRADQYIKNAVLIPAALLGLVALLLGYGAVVYLFFVREALPIVVDSSTLLITGAIIGLGHALYQGFLFRTYPDHFARKQRRRDLIRAGNVRKLEVVDPIAHPGRGLIITAYIGLFSGFIWLAFVYSSRLNPLAAICLPLAGFYNARFLYWKRRFPQPSR